MKYMTFNVQHCASYLGNGRIRFPLFAEAIKKRGADIVGLNEIRGEGGSVDYEAQTEILSSLSGITHYYFALTTRYCTVPLYLFRFNRAPICESSLGVILYRWGILCNNTSEKCNHTSEQMDG